MCFLFFYFGEIGIVNTRFFFINIQKLQGFLMYEISNIQNSVTYPAYSRLLSAILMYFFHLEHVPV